MCPILYYEKNLKFCHKIIRELSCFVVREQLKELTKQYDKSENDLKALQSVGQVHELFS